MEKTLVAKLNISIITLSLALGVLIGATYTAMRVIGGLTATIREDITRSTIQVERPAKISILSQAYGASKENIDLLREAYPTSDFESLLPFTNSMSELASRVGVDVSTTITSDKPLSAPQAGAYIPFRVEMRTTYSTFERYVAELEKLRYFIEIENYSIKDSVNVNGVSDVRIEARLYVRSEERVGP